MLKCQWKTNRMGSLVCDLLQSHLWGQKCLITWAVTPGDTEQSWGQHRGRTSCLRPLFWGSTPRTGEITKLRSVFFIHSSKACKPKAQEKKPLRWRTHTRKQASLLFKSHIRPIACACTPSRNEFHAEPLTHTDANPHTPTHAHQEVRPTLSLLLSLLFSYVVLHSFIFFPLLYLALSLSRSYSLPADCAGFQGRVEKGRTTDGL